MLLKPNEPTSKINRHVGRNYPKPFSRESQNHNNARKNTLQGWFGCVIWYRCIRCNRGGAETRQDNDTHDKTPRKVPKNCTKIYKPDSKTNDAQKQRRFKEISRFSRSHHKGGGVGIWAHESLSTSVVAKVIENSLSDHNTILCSMSLSSTPKVSHIQFKRSIKPHYTHFPLKKHTVRSNTKGWVNDSIKISSFNLKDLFHLKTTFPDIGFSYDEVKKRM
nr:unnamed protein product [Callosobruchus analis]